MCTRWLMGLAFPFFTLVYLNGMDAEIDVSKFEYEEVGEEYFKYITIELINNTDETVSVELTSAGFIINSKQEQSPWKKSEQSSVTPTRAISLKKPVNSKYDIDIYSKQQRIRKTTQSFVESSTLTIKDESGSHAYLEQPIELECNEFYSLTKKYNIFICEKKPKKMHYD